MHWVTLQDIYNNEFFVNDTKTKFQKMDLDGEVTLDDLKRVDKSGFTDKDHNCYHMLLLITLGKSSARGIETFECLKNIHELLGKFSNHFFVLLDAIYSIIHQEILSDRKTNIIKESILEIYWIQSKFDNFRTDSLSAILNLIDVFYHPLFYDYLLNLKKNQISEHIESLQMLCYSKKIGVDIESLFKVLLIVIPDDFFNYQKLNEKFPNSDLNDLLKIEAYYKYLCEPSTFNFIQLQNLEKGTKDEQLPIDPSEVMLELSPNPMEFDFEDFPINESELIIVHTRDGPLKTAVFGTQDKRFAIKKYSFPISERNLRRIQKEINIYEILSEKANEFNCFIKFHGWMRKSDAIYLKMDYHKSNLDAIIKKNSTKVNNYKELFHINYLTNIFLKLIRSYSEMATLKIFQQDIKTDNLVCNSDHELKIIDFNVAYDHENPESFSIKVGTEGFRAPEREYGSENIDIEKADVFSLGMVFFKMLINIPPNMKLNLIENSSELFQLIEMIENDWAKDLLKMMLHIDPHQRLYFKDLLAFFEPLVTSTSI